VKINGTRARRDEPEPGGLDGGGGSGLEVTMFLLLEHGDAQPRSSHGHAREAA
jgi:hypothetical protein